MLPKKLQLWSLPPCKRRPAQPGVARRQTRTEHASIRANPRKGRWKAPFGGIFAATFAFHHRTIPIAASRRPSVRSPARRPRLRDRPRRSDRTPRSAPMSAPGAATCTSSLSTPTPPLRHQRRGRPARWLQARPGLSEKLTPSTSATSIQLSRRPGRSGLRLQRVRPGRRLRFRRRPSERRCVTAPTSTPTPGNAWQMGSGRRS